MMASKRQQFTSLHSTEASQPLILSRPSYRVLSALLMILLFLIPALLRLVPVSAQTPQAYVAPPAIDQRDDIRLPADFSRVEFYLITVDVGNNVWDNFGHTALRMVDDNSNTDLLFNWGLFDTSGGVVRFGINFARGIMDYQLGVAPPAWELGGYQQAGRTVWQDRLRLTQAQKEQLYERLAWNLRPDNIVYAYDYFYDNCTTRVRDYLNEALDGQLHAQTAAPTQRTFRDEVLSHYASLPLIGVSLDVLMNQRIDQRMSQWERMFLPLQLREQLNRLGLLADSEVLMQFPAPEAGPDPYYLIAVLLLPLLLLVASLRKASIASFSSQPGFALRMPALSYRVLGLIGLGVALFSGVYGLIMSLGWWISSHQDLHGNLNLLLFWPTDLLGLGIAVRWLVAGQPVMMTGARHRLIVSYLLLHVVAALVYLVIGGFGISGQRVGSLMLYVVPVLLLFALVVSAAGVRRSRGLRFN